MDAHKIYTYSQVHTHTHTLYSDFKVYLKCFLKVQNSYSAMGYLTLAKPVSSKPPLPYLRNEKNNSAFFIESLRKWHWNLADQGLAMSVHVKVLLLKNCRGPKQEQQLIRSAEEPEQMQARMDTTVPRCPRTQVLLPDTLISSTLRFTS